MSRQLKVIYEGEKQWWVAEYDTETDKITYYVDKFETEKQAEEYIEEVKNV